VPVSYTLTRGEKKRSQQGSFKKTGAPKANSQKEGEKIIVCWRGREALERENLCFAGGLGTKWGEGGPGVTEDGKIKINKTPNYLIT